MTSLFCSRSTVASCAKICMLSASTFSGLVLLMGALLACTKRRNWVVS